MLVIYDLDGTLVDTTQRYAYSIAQEIAKTPASGDLQKVGVEQFVTFLSRSELAGATVMEKFQALDTEFNTDFAGQVDNIVPKLRARKTETYKPGCSFDSVGEGLTSLLRQGHRLAIATSAEPDSLAYAMRVTKLHRFFGAHAFGCDANTPKKPDRAVLYNVLQATGYTADRAVFVGDSVVDMQAARAAGLWAVGYIAPNVEDQQAAREALYNAGAHHTIMNHREMRPFIDMHLPMLRERARYLEQVKARDHKPS